MAVEADSLELYESEVYVATRSGLPRRDGARGYGTGTALQGHIETKRQIVRGVSGEEVVAQGRVMLTDVYPDLDEDTYLTLPNGTSPTVVAVETTYGPNIDTGTTGPYQSILYFGS